MLATTWHTCQHDDMQCDNQSNTAVNVASFVQAHSNTTQPVKETTVRKLSKMPVFQDLNPRSNNSAPAIATVDKHQCGPKIAKAPKADD